MFTNCVGGRVCISSGKPCCADNEVKDLITIVDDSKAKQALHQDTAYPEVEDILRPKVSKNFTEICISLQRAAPSEPLGLGINDHEGVELVVDAVYPGCLVHRWNAEQQQAVTSGTISSSLASLSTGAKVIREGDILHSVNGIFDNKQRMLLQLKEATVMDLVFHRVEALNFTIKDSTVTK